MEQLAIFALPRSLEDSPHSIDSNIAVVEPDEHSNTTSLVHVPLRKTSWSTIMLRPGEKLTEDIGPALKDASKKGVPPNARWTRIDRKLVSPEALNIGNERYEEKVDCVIVLRVLSKEEIEKYAAKTREIRQNRGSITSGEGETTEYPNVSQSISDDGDPETMRPVCDTDDGSWDFLRQEEPIENPLVTLGSVSTHDGRETLILGKNRPRYKISRLTKSHGMPLWRRDIHYDFVRALFENDTRAFTKFRNGTKGHTFLNVYCDALYDSDEMDTTISGLLQELLVNNRQKLLDVATMAFLINVGRIGRNMTRKS